ncbi:MAG: hypothetical protein WC517_04555 [Patescibacteria group bacterium]
MKRIIVSRITVNPEYHGENSPPFYKATIAGEDDKAIVSKHRHEAIGLLVTRYPAEFGIKIVDKKVDE